MKIFKFSSINLGCTKNLVDTQHLLGKIFTANEKEIGIQPQYYTDPYDTEVDYVFLNTCGFISSGREEAQHTITKLLKKNKTIYLLGCAVQYYKNIAKQESEIQNSKYNTQNKIFSLSRNDFSTITLKELIHGYESKEFKAFEFSKSPRVYTNIDYKFEYLKIAEGCDNNCTFCIIPKIRGKQKSLPIETIIQEAKNMIKNGIEEIILIAQDSTRYGTDLYGKPALFDLLNQLEHIKGNFTFRLLYLYPDILSLEHLQKLTTFKKFIPYFDIPLQHVSAPILKRMGRFYDEKAIDTFLNFIKTNFKKRFIRTNIIIGFPGETDSDQQKLLDFLAKDYFDNIALFEYHDEPYATSSKLPNKIPTNTIRERFLKVDNLVDRLLTDKETQRKGQKTKGYIMEIKEKNNYKLSITNYTLIVRPTLHCPDVDPYDTITEKNIIKIYNKTGTLDIGDKIDYIV